MSVVITRPAGDPVVYVAKKPEDVSPITFDFSGVLPAGVVLTGSPQVTATDLGHIAGSTNLTVSGIALDGSATRVTARIAGGTPRADYRLAAVCGDAAADVWAIDCVVQVRQADGP